MEPSVKKVLIEGWEKIGRFAAASYIVGPELKDGLKACRRQATRQCPTTLAYWNNVKESPELVAAAYLRALDALASEKLDSYLSIKAPFIGFNRTLFKEVLERSKMRSVPLHFDAQGHGEADDTFAMIDEAQTHYPGIGCTLPGRWRRSLADADWAIQRALPVRVVKGQLPDPQTPEINLREGFLAVIDRLAGRARSVSVATHDGPLAEKAIDRLLKARTPCQVELLYGLPAQPVRRIAERAGVPVCLYIPYGHGFLPYWFSQAYRRPVIFWWITRDIARATASNVLIGR